MFEIRQLEVKTVLTRLPASEPDAGFMVRPRMCRVDGVWIIVLQRQCMWRLMWHEDRIG